MTTVVVGTDEQFNLNFTAIFKGLKGIKPNELLESPIVTLYGYPWSLVASLNESTGRISFRLKNSGDIEVRIGFALSIRNAGNSEDWLISSIPCESCVHTFSPQNPFSASVCNWTYPGKKEVTTLTFFETNRNIVPVLESTLTNDLSVAIKQQPPDVVFIVREVCIDMHKVLLCARSDVFRTMFETTMKETQTNEIVITDYHVDAVRGFVSYLYSDTVDGATMKLHTMDLLKLSHMYNVEGLNLLCQQHFVTTVTNENVFDHLKLADVYSAEYLQKKSVEHIVSHAGTISTMYGVDVFTALPEHLNKLVLNKFIDHKIAHGDEGRLDRDDSMPLAKKAKKQNTSTETAEGWCVIS